MTTKIKFNLILKALRKQKGWTMEELGEKMNKTKSAISRWESGDNSPKVDDIEKLTQLFGVNVEELIFGVDDTETLSSIYYQLEEPRKLKVYNYATQQLKEQQAKPVTNMTSIRDYRSKRKEEMTTIDWLGAASAGTGEFLVNSMQKEEIELPAEQIPEGADFCLSVNGNSMEPVFMDDSYIFIEEVEEISDGSIAVVIVNNEAYLKRIHFTNNHAILESFNTEYDEIIVTENDDFRIVGRVIF